MNDRSKKLFLVELKEGAEPPPSWPVLGFSDYGDCAASLSEAEIALSPLVVSALPAVEAEEGDHGALRIVGSDETSWIVLV